MKISRYNNGRSVTAYTIDGWICVVTEDDNIRFFSPNGRFAGTAKRHKGRRDIIYVKGVSKDIIIKFENLLRKVKW